VEVPGAQRCYGRAQDSGQSRVQRLDHKGDSSGHGIVLPQVGKKRGNRAAGMDGGAFGDGEVDGNTRAEPAPIQGINWLRIVQENLRCAGSAKRYGWPSGPMGWPIEVRCLAP